MVDQIVSVDAGNGGTNAILAQDKGYKKVYFPSVRAAASGDTLGLGGQFELDYEYIDWGDHRYVVGDDVGRISRRSVERHQGAFRYGDEFHEFLVTVALARLGVETGTVDLTLFAPPGMYTNAKESIEQRQIQQASNFNPAFHKALVSLAAARYKLGQLAAAQRLWLDVLKQEPRYDDATYMQRDLNLPMEMMGDVADLIESITV